MVWHWSIDTKKFKKKYPKEYQIWKITQQINYGLDEGEKLDEKQVKKVWSKIKPNLDPYKARLLKFLLWQKLSSLPSNLSFWNLPKNNRQ